MFVMVVSFIVAVPFSLVLSSFDLTEPRRRSHWPPQQSSSGRISRGLGTPLVRGRSPLLRTSQPRSDTASRSFFEDFLVVSDPTARRFRGCAGFLDVIRPVDNARAAYLVPSDVAPRCGRFAMARERTPQTVGVLGVSGAGLRHACPDNPVRRRGASAEVPGSAAGARRA